MSGLRCPLTAPEAGRGRREPESRPGAPSSTPSARGVRERARRAEERNTADDADTSDTPRSDTGAAGSTTTDGATEADTTGGGATAPSAALDTGATVTRRAADADSIAPTGAAAAGVSEGTDWRSRSGPGAGTGPPRPVNPSKQLVHVLMPLTTLLGLDEQA